MKIDMKQPILDKNDAIARELRERFAEHHVYVVDLQKTGRARIARSFLGGLDDARHDSQFVHETPIAKGVFPDAPSIRLLW